MKNVAVLFAGGTGARMGNADKPKQFLKIDNKPIIIHTVEKFDKCRMIDSIAIALLEEYIPYMEELIGEFNINKVKWIVAGGETGQLSIFNGLDAVFRDKSVDKDTVVLIHDGVRPIIDEHLILENIVTTRTHGNAITVVGATETVFSSKDKKNIDSLLNREDLFYARAPQSFFLKDIYACHKKELEAGIVNNIDSCSLMFKHGHKLNFVKGKSSNIKITNYEDYYIFKALYDLEQKRKEMEMLT